MSSGRPDSRIFASYPMPAKIDLLNEQPRRESLVESRLEDKIGPISGSAHSEVAPRITVTEQQNTLMSTNTGHNFGNQQRPQEQFWPSCSNHELLENQREQQDERSASRCEIKETRIVINQHSSPIVSQGNFNQQQQSSSSANNHGQKSDTYRQIQENQSDPHHLHQQLQQTTTTTVTKQSTNQLPSLNMALNQTINHNKAVLAAELAEKEEKLMREITALHQRPYSPYQTPAKIDLTNEQRIIQQQYRNAPQVSSRSNSRASNRSTAGDDLLEKEAKLLKEIEEIESKPYNPQTMIVEREQWYEYPQNRPNDRHLTDSVRRVRDFCSLPPGLCEDKHLHEENLPPRPGRVSATPESIHTTIIRSPKREIDNKSPLPFAFDNFTTKGVRGNIASVGAVEPDRPRPPIFPIVKRSPSPNVARG